MSNKHKIKNLWGDLPVEDNIRTPYVILKEQASILTEATNGLLVGNVKKETFSNESGDSGFECTLEITVPSINNYSISIVGISYPITLYPSQIYNRVTRDKVKDCQTEEDLDKNLEEILSSDQVKRVILGLLSEVRLDAAEPEF